MSPAPGQAGALVGTPTECREQRAGGGTSAGRMPSKVTQHTWPATWNILIAAITSQKRCTQKQYWTL